MITKTKTRLTDTRNHFKPFNYPWAYDAWLKHEQAHWLHSEVPMAEDVKDWKKKLTAERNYEYKFDRINDNFEYAKEHGEFRPKLKLSYTATGLSAGSYETSFVIKQGNKHEGYYTFGNGRYFKYYMPTKPNVIARFFMKTCLALRWVDEKNG